jgi:hypothetical protein
LRILVTAAIINLIIIYFIIQGATKSTRIHLESIKQNLILTAIAKKEGIESTLLNNILKISTEDELRKFYANNKI